MNSTGKGSRRRTITALIGVLISAIFVYLTFRKSDAGAFIESISKVCIPVLAMSLVTKLLGFVCLALRSKIVLAPVAPLRLGRILKSILLAFAGNNLLPVRMGELLRVDYLARNAKVAHSVCLAVVVVERLLDGLCLLALVCLGLALMLFDVPVNAVFYLAAFGIVCLFVLAFVAARRPALLGRGIHRAFTTLHMPRIASIASSKVDAFSTGLSSLSSARSIAAAVSFTFGFWAFSLLSIRIWIAAFELDMPWYSPIVILVFSSFGTLIPAAPGYIGTYHYFTKAGLGFLQVSKAQADAFIVVGHFVAVVPFTLVSIVVLFRDFIRKDLFPSTEHPEDPPQTSTSPPEQTP